MLPRPMSLLPTFFIVGAPKSGTTSLHAYLAGHPGIAMTSVKECMLFTGPDWRENLARHDWTPYPHPERLMVRDRPEIYA